MSLRESARRMYAAQYGGGNAKRKVATQYLQQIPSTIEQIAINVESKREKAAEEWAEKRESTLDQIKNNPEARAKLAEKLDAMKNRYDAAIRKSTSPFAGKKKKQEAANEIAAINSEILAFQEDMANFDKILSTRGTYSKANTIGDSADNAWVYGDESTRNIEFRDDGAYVIQPSTGKEIRLKDFKQPLIRWDEGIDDAGKLLNKVGGNAMQNTPWANVEKMLIGQANTLMSDKAKFKSLIFDDILDFNFAAENYPDRDLNELKALYDIDPEFQKEMMSKWKEAYIAEGKEMYDITGAKDDEEEEITEEKTPTQIKVAEDKARRAAEANKNAFADLESEGVGKLSDGRYIVKHESGKYYYTSDPSKQLDPENPPRMYSLAALKAAEL